MDPNRRKLLKAALVGAGGLGLRGLASALPAGLLAGPSRAAAADACNATILPASGALAAPDRTQRIILITSASGDPLNANVPGCYVNPAIYHPPDMPAVSVNLGGTDYQCGKPWGDLLAAVPALQDRTCFFHHATYSNAHGDHAKVNALMGAIRRQELFVSLMARYLHACGPSATTQAPPIVLSDVLVRYQGAVLPVLNTGALSRVLARPTGTTLTLRDRRDADVTRLNTLLRASGTPAQQAAVDAYATAQAEARAMDPTLVGSISGTSADGTDQRRLNSAAVSILAMNMSPVVVMSYDWGGDNHSDYRLQNENAAHVESCDGLADLYRKLVYRGIQDDVTIVCMNVFGRTLNAANRNGNANGRDHNAAHHCTVIIGRGFRGSVIGGVVATPSGNEFRAQDIDSATGRPVAGGDVEYLITLASLGKTLGAGLGATRAAIDDQITSGKYVEAALR